MLADFLWAAAFACALAALTRSGRWLALGFAVAQLLELAQVHPAVPGTFDVADMIAIGLGWGLGCAIDAASTRLVTRTAPC